MDSIHYILYTLLKVAIATTSYEWPNQPLPEISWSEDKEYVKVSDDADTHAYYDIHNEVIYMPSDCTPTKLLNSPICKGILVHELVHYLQGVNGTRDAVTCDGYFNNEVEAYGAQVRYLRSELLPATRPRIPMPKHCVE